MKIKIRLIKRSIKENCKTRSKILWRVIKMRKEYDFTKAKPNPYIKKLRKQISIRIDIDTIEYFKKRAEETGITYQNLINLYLSDCAAHNRKINIIWK